MDKLKEPMVIKIEHYSTASRRKLLFQNVKQRIASLEELYDFYGLYTDGMITRTIERGFLTKSDTFTLVFFPNFGEIIDA